MQPIVDFTAFSRLLFSEKQEQRLGDAIDDADRGDLTEGSEAIAK